jgi:hypothetical protein
MLVNYAVIYWLHPRENMTKSIKFGVQVEMECELKFGINLKLDLISLLSQNIIVLQRYGFSLGPLTDFRVLPDMIIPSPDMAFGDRDE